MNNENQSKQFQDFLGATKSFESSLWKYLAGTAVMAGVLTAGQIGNFPKAFYSLSEVSGVIAGMAAIIPAYLRRLSHSSEKLNEVINYRPILLPLRALLTLAFSIASFFLYYKAASEAQTTCVLFMVLGIYFFFRVIAESVHHMYMTESQEILWNNLSPKERGEWLASQRAIVKTTEELKKLSEITQAHTKLLQMNVSDINAKLDKQARAELSNQGLRGKILALLYPFRRPTLNLRERLGWITEAERQNLIAGQKALIELLK
jgi:hypothetical protein